MTWLFHLWHLYHTSLPCVLSCKKFIYFEGNTQFYKIISCWICWSYNPLKKLKPFYIFSEFSHFTRRYCRYEEIYFHVLCFNFFGTLFQVFSNIFNAYFQNYLFCLFYYSLKKQIIRYFLEFISYRTYYLINIQSFYSVHLVRILSPKILSWILKEMMVFIGMEIHFIVKNYHKRL